MTLEELCRELSISVVTGRNWLKLGKIKPQCTEDTEDSFSNEYVMQLKENILSGVNDSLKSRRNKKYVCGSALYHSYVSENSSNAVVVDKLLHKVCKLHEAEMLSGICKQYPQDKEDIEQIKDGDLLHLFLLADCAVKLLCQRNNRSESCCNGIKSFLNEEISFGGYDSFIYDLIPNEKAARRCITDYPELFQTTYIYEEKEDILGLLYISGNNLRDRKASGSYYTPTKIVRRVIDKLFEKNAVGKSVIDPCCGTGNFLLQLPDAYSMDYIYGCDIDKVSVTITRINMALRFYGCEADLIRRHITVRNTLLKCEISSDNCVNDMTDTYAEILDKRYDYVIGNPPWGYSYSEEEKKWLRKIYKSATGNNVESYDLFIERAMSMLKVNGVFSFVLPEAVLNVKIHQKIREILLEKTSVQYIEFLGDIFDKVQCPSIIMQVKYSMQPMSCVGMEVCRRESKFTIEKERCVKAKYFEFEMTDIEYGLLDKIYNGVQVEYLKNQAVFALGIITGNNKDMITDNQMDNGERILKGSDLKKYQIAGECRYIVYEPDKFQQAASIEYYRAPEKLLYRFISDKLVFAYDNAQILSLNSCNVLIPKIARMDIKYILAILNSSIAQFIYQKRFHSLKVLRSHIEQIPIPVADKQKRQQIVQFVDQIMADSFHKQQNGEYYRYLYNKIDEMICKLYNLTDEEYGYILNNNLRL